MSSVIQSEANASSRGRIYKCHLQLELPHSSHAEAMTVINYRRRSTQSA